VQGALEHRIVVEFGLVPGPIASEAAKVHHNDLVHRLRVAIGLGLERRRHVQPNTGKLEELAPEVAG
jgi:hypothetical protein